MRRLYELARAERREMLRRALDGGPQDRFDYLVNREMENASRDLLVYGQCAFDTRQVGERIAFRFIRLGKISIRRRAKA